MDPFGDRNRTAASVETLRKPPPDYFENFLHEFRRRRATNCVVNRLGASALSAHRFRVPAQSPFVRNSSAAIAAAVGCAAVISITIYQQPDTTQFALQSSPVPTRSPNTEKELDFPPPEFIPSFDTQPAVLPASSRDIRMLPVLPANPLRSDEFVPLKLEWESLDDR